MTLLHLYCHHSHLLSSFSVLLQIETLPLLYILPIINFSPSTGLMLQIRAIFRIICLSVFIAAHVWQAIVFYSISFFFSNTALCGQ